MTREKILDRVSIRHSDRKNYERLREKDSPFFGKENKDLFIFAMITGYREGSRIKLDKKYGFVRIEYFNGREKAIIKSIAIAEEGDLEVLLDEKKVYLIAEEYASGGIKIIKNKALGGEFGSYFKRLESELIEEYEKAVV